METSAFNMYLMAYDFIFFSCATEIIVPWWINEIRCDIDDDVE